jgi:hypothetical protein
MNIASGFGRVPSAGNRYPGLVVPSANQPIDCFGRYRQYRSIRQKLPGACSDNLFHRFIFKAICFHNPLCKNIFPYNLTFFIDGNIRKTKKSAISSNYGYQEFRLAGVSLGMDFGVGIE